MLFIFTEDLGVHSVSYIESLSLMQLGNKAYRCGKLLLKGFNVPQTLILPFDIYQAHIHQLCIQKEIDFVLKNSDSTVALATLSFIRKRIQTSNLNDHVLTEIEKFLSSITHGVSVRSSASLEDTPSRSAAGQYVTILNCRNIAEIERAILRCWSSLWMPSAFKYGVTENHFSPQMSVVIMDMVDSISSGVVFTKNPLNGADEAIIEAVWGLGEGLVSKGLTPDHLVFDSEMNKIYSKIAYKPFQYRIVGDKKIAKTTVPLKNQTSPALSNEQAANLIKKAKEIEFFFGKAQDIEWTFDKTGSLWILQSRDITSEKIPLPDFLHPEPGEWKIVDHITHPGTRCFSEYYYVPMEEGWNEEAIEIGILNRVKIREVNGFMYYQMGMVESQQEFFNMCQTNEGYWEQKRYFDRLNLWNESVKPSAIKQLTALQNTNINKLSHKKFIDHLRHCFSVTKRMVKNHHLFTYTSFIPIGDFIIQVCKWTQKEPVDVLNVLRGSAPNRLFMGREYPGVEKLLNSLQENTTALYLLSKVDEEPKNAGQILDQLLGLNDSIKRGLKFMVNHFGYRIVNSYDIGTETFVERPDLLLKSIKSILNNKIYSGHHDYKKEISTIRNLVPNKKRLLFDEMFHDVRKMERLRDERGMYSDLWAIGILRHVFLEAGRRLVKKGIINSSRLALEASHREIIDLLGGNLVISPEELEKRYQYRTHYTVKDAPSVLGEFQTEKLDLSGLPISMARTMNGLISAVMLAVEHVRHETEEKEALIGVSASRGVVEGIAKVIKSDSQINEINKGDILVVYQTTASFNGVFPLIKGIISQYGGVLSHPAILAREYEIPCIVGCSGAIKHIQTGMRVRLDGNKGEVKITSKKDHFVQRLKSLQCKYFGPMQGRNRNRVINHVETVSSKLKVIEKIRKSPICNDILIKHFNNQISTDKAIEEIIKSKIGITPKLLESFTRRYNIEFHICDACNLRCNGCTYFQDVASKPKAVSFPFDQVGRIFSVIRPKSITLVGGGEPALYKSHKQKLGDFIYAIGNGEFNCAPEIGLISNGTLWPMGNSKWHHYVKWVRYSLDASSVELYMRGKGANYFEKVIENVFQTLTETKIPQVGVGFLYHPGNIAEAGPLISLLANRIRKNCPEQLHRFNIQFRPWRMPIGDPSINERILSHSDIEESSSILLSYIDRDNSLESFIRENTNIAVNLICGGAREKVEPFSECYFGLAKTVVRANGDLYPCFRSAASRDPNFYCGNILTDTSLKIALRELYVSIFSTQKICVPNNEKCLFCVFNNIFENAIANKSKPMQVLAGDYFF